MDEPTSMFNVEDVKLLLNTVKTIAERGVSIIYISHSLKEVVRIADRITVIRDGLSINTYDNSDKDADINKIVNDMVGRPVSAFYEREEHKIGDIAFEVRDLVVKPHTEPISFNIRRGEIMGFAGMVGSGRTEIANAIVGAKRNIGGKIIFNGKELYIKDPSDSVKYGIGYITEDRQGLGLMLDASVVENLTAVGLQTKIKQFFINIKNFIPLIADIVKKLNIKIVSPMQEVKNLSGGNQQKVVLGKWLFTECDMYIFDEPTRGIDVNAKSEFYKIISGLAADGKVVMMISSDMPELISMSDRVTVVRKGKIVKTLESSEISENSIIRYALEVHKDEQ
ncbi:MAG: sugar ABC transporter ATP-binding protein [Actinomycetota bacterium]|nr:sugar ABC transporter ATP-binding protein [Actinomycetota bacterium]